MKVGILIKGNSKRRQLAEELVSLLEKEQYSIVKRVTQTAEDHVDLLQDLLKNNCDVIIAAGGDGTLHQSVNAIVKSGRSKTTKLAHLPIGTANDFARSIEQTSDPQTLLDKLKEERFSWIDIGKITTSSSPEDDFFINIADAGIGGEIIHGVNKRKQAGSIIYSLSIIKGLVTFKRKTVTIKFDHETYEGKLLSLVMANGNYFANGLNIAPHAELNNGKFAITLFGDVTLADYFKNIKRIKKGKFLDHKEVKYLESTFIEITTTPENMNHLEADGEYIGTTRAKISILPKHIEFLL